LYGFDEQFRHRFVGPEPTCRVQRGSNERRDPQVATGDRGRQPMSPLDRDEITAQNFVGVWDEHV
jgi:hypothetical protein